MTLQNKAIVALGMIAMVFPAIAQTTSGTNTGTLTVTLKRKKKLDPNPYRPKLPGQDVFIFAGYEKGVLTVEIPVDAESGVVTIGTDMFDVFCATIDRSSNTIELPPLSGEFLLTVTFDNGDVYEGEISL